MDIMKYGSECEVIEPEALKARVAAEFEAGLALSPMKAGLADPSPMAIASGK